MQKAFRSGFVVLSLVAGAMGTPVSETPPAYAAEQPSVTPPKPLLNAHSKDNGYGVDFTFPIHHDVNKLTHHGERYTKYMEGCVKRYNKGSCEGSERSRRQLNLRQPPTQQNYTELGFAKVKAPEGAIRPLQKFFADHMDRAAPEQWPAGNTYTNHWEEPTMMLSLEDRSFPEGRRLKAQVECARGEHGRVKVLKGQPANGFTLSTRLCAPPRAAAALCRAS